MVCFKIIIICLTHPFCFTQNLSCSLGCLVCCYASHHWFIWKLQKNIEHTKTSLLNSSFNTFYRFYTIPYKQNLTFMQGTRNKQERCCGLMVSMLDSRLSSLGSSNGWGHCVVFLGKTRYSHSAFLHPGV